MPYCTVDEVKSAISYPSTNAPVSDADIEEFILDAQDEIERKYKTKFGNVEDNGTASSSTSSTLVDSSKSWTDDAYEGMVVWIYSGTGSGQYREITANDSTSLTVSEDWDTNPDGTSKYRITLLGYADENVDGNGQTSQQVRYNPLIALNSLTIESTDIDVDDVYVYTHQGTLTLGKNAAQRNFYAGDPQAVNMIYIFGVYPLPRIIKRLCVCIAGMKTLVSQIAGTYDDFTSLSMPGLEGSKGEPYTNIRESVQRLQNEAKSITETYIPWTVFA